MSNKLPQSVWPKATTKTIKPQVFAGGRDKKFTSSAYGGNTSQSKVMQYQERGSGQSSGKVFQGLIRAD